MPQSQELRRRHQRFRITVDNQFAVVVQLREDCALLNIAIGPVNVVALILSICNTPNELFFLLGRKHKVFFG